MLSAGSVLSQANQGEHSKDTQGAERTMLWTIQPVYVAVLYIMTQTLLHATLCGRLKHCAWSYADFTNRVEDMRLQDLAEGDSKELVSQV